MGLKTSHLVIVAIVVVCALAVAMWGGFDFSFNLVYVGALVVFGVIAAVIVTVVARIRDRSDR